VIPLTSISLADYKEKYGGGKQTTTSKGNKFNAQKVVFDGMTFDSRKEHKRYIELKAMSQRGEIYDLQHHTKFELVPSVKLEGEKRAKPAIRYFADFTYYTALGAYVVEDVKSKATRKLAPYRQKKHLMKTVHGIDIKEV